MSERVPVLVVDDNLGFLRVVQTILEKATPSFAVHAVESGTEALAFLERRPPYADAPRPAFIVLDFHLPDMNAPEILTALASRGDLGDIPVMVLSQAAWEEDEIAARAAGAIKFRVKPSRVQALRDEVIQFWKEHAHGGTRPPD